MLEASQAFGVGSKSSRQNLQRDVASEFAVGRDIPRPSRPRQSRRGFHNGLNVCREGSPWVSSQPKLGRA